MIYECISKEKMHKIITHSLLCSASKKVLLNDIISMMYRNMNFL